MIFEGPIRKMKTGCEAGLVRYVMPIGDYEVPLNEMVGRKIKLTYLGEIHCIHCGKKTNKSFSQGYCFPCFRSLPETDMCIVKPELCHFAKGTCRDPEWGQKHCMVEHSIYLANSSGLKIGITRSHQQTTRWMDQGALQALVIGKVKSRLEAGMAEIAFKSKVSDKTNWRKMLQGDVEPLNLREYRDALIDTIGGQSNVELVNEDVYEFTYPVKIFPRKIIPLNFDKHPDIDDELLGIKGQYLIFAGGVINIRKFAGYQMRLAV